MNEDRIEQHLIQTEHRINLRGRLNRAQALDTYCPECGARPGDPCTYLPDPTLVGRSISSRNVQRLKDREGMPTSKPHNARHQTEAQRLAGWLYRHGSLLVVPERADRDERARCMNCGEALRVRVRDLSRPLFARTLAKARTYKEGVHQWDGWRHVKGSYSFCTLATNEAPRLAVGFPMAPRPIPGLAVDTITLETS